MYTKFSGYLPEFFILKFNLTFLKIHSIFSEKSSNFFLKFIRNFLKLCMKFSRSLREIFYSLLWIFLAFGQKFLRIYVKLSQNLHKFLLLNLPEIYSKFTLSFLQNSPDIFSKFTQNFFKINRKFSRNVHEIFCTFTWIFYF